MKKVNSISLPFILVFVKKSGNVFRWVFTLILIFSLGDVLIANTEQEQVRLFGIDNILLPQDSLALMNSSLVDYHVDYDIALATSNHEEIASSLHKIGLVYYKLGQLDLATNYSWRLLNISNKYSLKKHTLYAYALLYKISLRNGQIQKANRFHQKYEETLTFLPSVENEKMVEIDPVDGFSTKDGETGQENSEVENKTTPLFVEEKAELINPRILYVIGAILTLILVFIFVLKNKESKNDVILVASPPLDIKYENSMVQSDGDVLQLVKEVEEKTSMESTVVVHEDKDINASQSKERKSELLQNEQDGKINDTWPDWLEVVLVDAKKKFSKESVHFDQNLIGDFREIEESDQIILTHYIVNVTDELSNISKVHSISFQLMNTVLGIVVIMIVNASNNHQLILNPFSWKKINKAFETNGDFKFVVSDNTERIAKLILKKNHPISNN